MSLINSRLFSALLAVGAMLVAGCHSDMYDQPRSKPLGASKFFANGQSSRPFVEGTVAHEAAGRDELLLTGKENGKFSNRFPFPVTEDMVRRGGERYNIYCSPCHGVLGDGKGMIVRRGFPAPPSYHTDSLRNAPAGHFVDVIGNGFGRMFSYADRVAPRDRWAIAAYIRALQLSQNLNVNELTDAQRQALNTPPAGSMPPARNEKH